MQIQEKSIIDVFDSRNDVFSHGLSNFCRSSNIFILSYSVHIEIMMKVSLYLIKFHM